MVDGSGRGKRSLGNCNAGEALMAAENGDSAVNWFDLRCGFHALQLIATRR